MSGRLKQGWRSGASALEFPALCLAAALLGACRSGGPLPPAEGPETSEPDAAAALILDRLDGIEDRIGALEEAMAAATGASDENPFPAPRLWRIDTTNLPEMGSAAAEVAIVEVTDFQCPYCRAHAADVFKRIKTELIDAGLVSYFVLDFPLDGHEFAAEAATAAHCAGEQGMYWEFHEGLFQTEIRSGGDIAAVADEIGLDVEEHDDCMLNGNRYLLVEAAQVQARRLAVTGTPTFFIGRRVDGRMIEGTTVMPGVRSFYEFHNRVIALANE